MPRVRSDIVEVSVFREGSAGFEVLQLLRAPEAGSALSETWQPVMGHIEEGETAVDAMWRELREEAGLPRNDPALLGVWSLDQVHPYFIARKDCIMLSPRFAARVAPGWEPAMNHEHTAARWVLAAEAARWF